MAKKKNPTPITKRPKTALLPPMESMVDKELEAAATKYVDLRDSRMDLQEDEENQKRTVMELMHARKKKTYRRLTPEGTLTIQIVDKKENVKVRLREEETE